MTIQELVAQAEENFRIAKQEVMFAVSGLIDTADAAIDALKNEKFNEIKAEEVMDAIQDDEFKNGEERKEVEDND